MHEVKLVSVFNCFRDGLRALAQRANTPHLLIIISGLLFLALIGLFQDNNNGFNRRTYQRNSAYKGIKSSFVTEQQRYFKSQREYPVTVNETVNQMLASQIDDIHRAYLEQLKTKKHDLEYTENVSFGVTYNRNQLLSISINAVQALGDNRSTIHTKSKTFDLNTGRPVDLAEVFTSPHYAQNRVLPDLRYLVAQEMKLVKPDFETKTLEEKLTLELANNFLIHSDGNFQFEFAPEQFGSQHAGKWVINLPVASYLPAIKSEWASRMFDQTIIDLNSPESSQNRSGFCNSHLCVALTFDDGPSQQTSRVLDILKEQNVKATFFILGKQAQAHPDILKRQIDEGHQVGYHGWGHTAFNRLSLGQLHDELNRTNEVIHQHRNYTPKVVRPPYGLLNRSAIKVLRERGQDIILWSVDPRDWDIKDAEQVYNRVVAASHNGAIILLHDLYSSTVDAVKPIINYFQDNGYYLVTVNTLLGDVSPSGTVYRKR